MIASNASNRQHLWPMSVSFGKAIAFTLALSCATHGQTTHYVDDDNCPAPGTGSLIDPYCSIQFAIDISWDDDTIEVAPGTYFEAINFLGKAITLISTDGAESTIIDATNVPDIGIGVSVVRCVSGETAATVLDGFMITGGTGDTRYYPYFPSGGGMFNDGSSPTVTNCTFSENEATSGGGMFNKVSDPTVINCIYTVNSARYGGGMYNSNSSPTVTNCAFSRNMGSGMFNSSSSPSVTKCTFSDNEALTGGGMLNGDSDPTVRNCMFVRNSANISGGGMYNAGSDPTMINCTFTVNSARNGAGVYNTNSSPTVTNCIFSRNMGSGMANSNGSSPSVTKCTFNDNEAVSGGGMLNTYSDPTVRQSMFVRNSARHGGGMYNTFSDPTMINCTLSSNTASSSSGGMYNYTSYPTMINCTFSSNTAGGIGGGMGNLGSSPTFTNCILWGNNPDEISNYYSTPTITYSDIAGSGGSADWNPLLGNDGGGNIDADPLFIDPHVIDNPPGNSYHNLRLTPGSPAIDAGDNTAVPIDVITDLNGNPRFVDDLYTPDTGSGMLPIVDMGAYEFQPLNVYIDIKPGSCPNLVNRRSRRVLPIAIVGRLDFDVSQIDIDSLTIARADGAGSSLIPLTASKGLGIIIEDVTAPLHEQSCACHELGGDGVDDLILKFSTADLVNALQLDILPSNTVVDLLLKGSLLDGTNFEASDCILVEEETRVFDVKRAFYDAR